MNTVLVVFLFQNEFDLNIFSLFIMFYILSLTYQLIKFEKDQPKECLKLFKINNISGFLLFFGIFLIN